MTQTSVDEGQSVSTAEQVYTNLMANYWVQQGMAYYDATKHSCYLMENTLEKVEGVALSSGQLVYDKANNAYTNYYVQPTKRIGDVYNTGVEKTKAALETGKNVAVKTSTVGIGAAVVATQLGLALGAGGATLMFDSLNVGKEAGSKLIVSVKQYEKAVEEKIWNAIHEVQRVAQIPVDKLSDTANTVLDIVDAMIERSLGVSIPNQGETSVTKRVRTLAATIAGTLTQKAHADVIDPINIQMKAILEHLSKSFVLADVVRSKREWALEKVEELSQSVSDLKIRFEQEASEYKTSPEVILMKSIRGSARQLQEKLTVLREKGNKLLGDGNSVEGAINYLEELEHHLSQAETIYDVRDEVLSEARQRLAELTSWTTSLVMKKNQ